VLKVWRRRVQMLQCTQTCQELHVEAVDYLEQDPRSEARLSEQQPLTVLAVDVTSDAADLELLKASLTQACRAGNRHCVDSDDSASRLGMQPMEPRCSAMVPTCSLHQESAGIFCFHAGGSRFAVARCPRQEIRVVGAISRQPK